MLEVEHDHLKYWKATNAKEPVLVEQSLLDSMKGCHNGHLDLELEKLAAQKVVYDAFMEILRLHLGAFVALLCPCQNHTPPLEKQIAILRIGDPDLKVTTAGQLYASRTFKKGELKLLACGLIQPLEESKLGKATCVLSAPKQPEPCVFTIVPGRHDFKAGCGMFVPFFLLKSAKEGGNMQASVHKSAGYGIPMYRNTALLHKGEELITDTQVEQASSRPSKRAKK